MHPQSIYSESPIDSSLLSLYIHQNYVGFCNEVENEVAGVSDWLSYIDSSGGEAVRFAHPLLLAMHLLIDHNSGTKQTRIVFTCLPLGRFILFLAP